MQRIIELSSVFLHFNTKQYFGYYFCKYQVKHMKQYKHF